MNELLYNRQQSARRDGQQYMVLDAFDSMYYGGLDVGVYMGQIFIDDIVQIGYVQTEQVRPCYGYADWTPHHFQHGARIVQGSFTINFKDANHILKTMDMVTSPQSSKAIDTILGVDPKMNNKVKQVLTKDLTMEDMMTMYTNSIGGGKEGFLQYKEAAKQLYWKLPGQQSTTNLMNDLVLPSDTRPRYKYEFDITIKYSEPEDDMRGIGDDNRSLKGSFGTIRTIKGCHLTSEAQTIEDSGKNVLEMYSFVAREVI